MGREIRRVPAHWDHPKTQQLNYRTGEMEDCYCPMFDKTYSQALKDCDEDYTPREQDYRPDWKPEEMTWWQMYETVSEGTPVTPPFATQEELVDYLVANGDFWDQLRRKEGNSRMNCDPWTRKQAEAFVFGGGWMPSMAIMGGNVVSGGKLAEMLNSPKESKI